MFMMFVGGLAEGLGMFGDIHGTYLGSFGECLDNAQDMFSRKTQESMTNTRPPIET